MRLTVEAVGIRLFVRPSVRLVGVSMGGGKPHRPHRQAVAASVCRRLQLTSQARSLGVIPAYLLRPRRRWSGRQFVIRDCFKLAGAKSVTDPYQSK